MKTAEELMNNAVRDICKVSVAAAPKSKVREIIEELILNLDINKISNVCDSCGIAANVLTCLEKYGTRPDKLCFDLSTSIEGVCDFCGKKGTKTPVRDFFYPDFSLLRKVTKPSPKLEE